MRETGRRLTSVLLLSAADEKARVSPGCMGAVFVTESEGLATST